MPDSRVTVVGIGADGLAGLSSAALAALREAEVLAGSARQLGLLDDSFNGERVSWTTPMMPAVDELFATHRGRPIAVLASGDPMFYGVGSRVVELGGADVVVLPSLSSVSLACARLGWQQQHTDVVSLVGRPHATVLAALAPGRRLLVLLSAPDAAADVCARLTAVGYGSSSVTLLEALSGPGEQIRRSTARGYDLAGQDYLSILAIDCVLDPDGIALPRTPGLPDDAFVSDGQLTKRELRALAISALAPHPGELLWDVGAGSGTVAVEWMRTHPSCRAVALEAREDRCALIAQNAEALGVPGLRVVHGRVPDALTELDAPDAIFVGGAVSVDGVLDACVAALGRGGRLVAHAVTLESESVLASWYAKLGGSLTRVSIERAAPIGSFTGWTPARPVTQWSYSA